jgi:hypothetical protein
VRLAHLRGRRFDALGRRHVAFVVEDVGSCVLSVSRL